MARGLFDASSHCGLSLFHRLSVIAVMMLGIVLGGCDARISSHGQVIDEAELNEIEPGVTTRAGVIALLGRPSFEGVFESGKVYYLNDIMLEPAAGRKRTTTRTLVVFIFDNNNLVKDIEVRDESTGQVVASLDKKTPTPGDNYTLTEQLFSTLRRRGN
jgi:outer membrane protein assembly factor BamE (lipoprotein component of BamABCDE complex)